MGHVPVSGPAARPLRLLGALTLSLALLAPLPADAGPSPQRTVRVRLARTGDPNGASGQPALSADARIVAFTTQATNLGRHDANGRVRDVYTYDQGTGAIRLVSRAADGGAADGPSHDPAVDADGRVVAFASSATDLVGGDANDRSDVFVAAPGILVRASVAPDGSDRPGWSGQPDLSADGHLVVFASAADGLVAGDENHHTDVFVRDLPAGVTRLVSAAAGGGPADGDSVAPAISPDGRYVTFTSRAGNLVAGDRNRLPDVFITDLATGATELVSVGQGGRQQNRSIARPFHQVSDVSRDGRVVVFDSDATNLVRGDRNRHTDVFVRDRVHGTTTRASLAATDQEPAGDSFTPRITPDGRWVAFDSAAEGLVADDPPGQDVYLRDLRRGTTVAVDVSSAGVRRGRERVPLVLDRPALADDASTVAFVSSAANLGGRDHNDLPDVFIRRLEPAASAYVGSITPGPRGGVVIAFRSRDRHPGPLRCRLDHRRPTLCPLGGLLLPRLSPGRHVLTALAGAPGSFYAPRPIVITLRQLHGKLVAHIRDSGKT